MAAREPAAVLAMAAGTRTSGHAPPRRSHRGGGPACAGTPIRLEAADTIVFLEAPAGTRPSGHPPQ